ncbi:S8 family serine peptidase [Colwellia hornerae]|uniref:S8 family serine peptidase n=1 Tax=Colwellia hornerae TaxID=89402 RepID=A0A5C6QSF3_9GAMM|nr:S8 family serine peptidase [Colwellia hornerae]TWX57662.1 S8 family serine peptidase [Colwellia hornerae]TWX62607.1 S8 family serine peptidase [Colwellia hornerae]TWX71518.1 S8 family serine peptidase [Colwellia hornerae]
MSKFFKKNGTHLFIAVALGATSTFSAAQSVIVELAQAPAAHKIYKARKAGTPLTNEQIQSYRSDLKAQQDNFLALLESRGIDAQVESASLAMPGGNALSVDYRYTLVFNGVTIDVNDASIAVLSALPEVKKVHQVRELSPSLDKSTAYTKAPKLYGQIAELGSYDDHREGFEGQGVYIAVIDTGIDWTNAMFGADATPPRHGALPPLAAANNNKVAYYLPITGEAMDAFGHGTHVAATAAGYLGYAPGPDSLPNTADDIAVHGVAPQAQLMGYQVCNVAGRCLSPATILALEDAVSPRSLTGYAKPVADVINLSLGGAGGPDDSTAVAASNAALAGVVVVAAAGNDGPGESTLGSPAAGRHVIAVAASNDPGVIPNSVEVLNEAGTAPDASVGAMSAALSSDSNAKQPITAPLAGRYVFAGLADTPEQVPVTVAGNICLVKRGSTAEAADNGTGLFANKAANCQAKGAIATVVYNSEAGDLGAVLAPAATPVVTISGTNGNILQSLGYDSAGVSMRSIQLNPMDPSMFEPGIAGFSSRGPIIGLGQIKADLAAPGVAILAATTKTGPPVASMADASGYTQASGTSMASPHVAGAAALVRQVNPDWSVATIRAALMNTATNPRYGDGTPKADNENNDSILAQGAGLIDVYAAAHAKAIMGVTGDGVIEPEFLASYSFGTLPVINNRITHHEPVTVTLKGLDAGEVTYQLSVANNRELEIDGLAVELSTDTLTVNANGEVTFDVNAVIDGDKVRNTWIERGNNDISHLQMMWYVIAERADGGETLRMPFYLKPTMSEPAGVVGNQSTAYQGTLLAGDNNAAAVAGVTYQDYPIDVDGSVFQLTADLNYTGNGVDDIDLFLLDPAGNELAKSTNSGEPEHITASVSMAGTYIVRVSGWANAPVDYDLVVTKALGGLAPTLAAPAADYTNNDDQSVDFDGNITLSWTANGGESGFEIEHSTDGVDFSPIALVDEMTSSYNVVNAANGLNHYRMRALFDGRIGYYVSMPSESVAVLVDRRSQEDITADIHTTMSNVNLTTGVFSLDLSMTNDSGNDYIPNIELTVFDIYSNSGNVKVINADSGGGSHGDFDYSKQLGSDEVFSSQEMTEIRTLQFSNTPTELFRFKVKVTAYKQRQSTTTNAAEIQAAEVASEPSLQQQVIQVIVNPLTGSVVSELVNDTANTLP